VFYDDTKADVWAMGVLLCVILIRKFPFKVCVCVCVCPLVSVPTLGYLHHTRTAMHVCVALLQRPVCVTGVSARVALIKCLKGFWHGLPW